MSQQDKSDLRLAILVLLVSFGLGIWVGRASASNLVTYSYEVRQ